MPVFNTVTMVNDRDDTEQTVFQIQGSNSVRVIKKADRICAYLFREWKQIDHHVPRDLSLPLVTYSRQKKVSVHHAKV